MLHRLLGKRTLNWSSDKISVCLFSGGGLWGGGCNRESLQDSAIHGGVYSTFEVCNFDGYCAIFLDVLPPVDHSHGHVARGGVGEVTCILPREEGGFHFWSQNAEQEINFRRSPASFWVILATNKITFKWRKAKSNSLIGQKNTWQMIT